MLDSLRITNFRCLEHFEVARLGRLNLIVGANNSGKSTVLEALQVYAGNANAALLAELAESHDEIPGAVATGGQDEASDGLYQDFFSGRCYPADELTSIEIGAVDRPDDTLRIRHAYLEEVREVTVVEGVESSRIWRRPLPKPLPSGVNQESVVPALVCSRGDWPLRTISLDRDPRRAAGLLRNQLDSRTVVCSVVGTEFLTTDSLGADWDRVVFTPIEGAILEAMRLVEPRLRNLTFVEASGGGRRTYRRIAKVQLDGLVRPVPLSSLGDGVRRILQIALRMATAKGGVLLVDEFENGLHYSVQPKVWAMLFEMARQLDVQVFATTHSWDCIHAFAEVARERRDVEGVLFRMGRSVLHSNKGQVIATVYDEDALYDMTQADLEVR